MTSKLEYLQRYMSSKSGEAGDGSKKKKRVKKSKTAKTLVLGTRMVDADDAWEQSAPSREAIEHKWEQDGAEDERPLVVAADGEDLVDPQDLPVYVDSDKYLGELQAKQKHKKEEDGDLSPPRKRLKERRGYSSDEASPPRRPRSDDASPPRRPMDANRSSRRRKESDNDDASPPRRKNDQDRRGRDHGDASPPRRSPKVSRSDREQHEGVLPPRKKDRRREQSVDADASPPRRKSIHGSSPRRGHERQEDASSSRTRSSQSSSKQQTQREDSDGDVSPPRRSSKEKTQMAESEREPGAAPINESLPSRQSRRHETGRRDSRSPSQSRAVSNQDRRTDSLGRDIPPRSNRKQRRSSSISRGENTSSRRRIRSSSRSKDRGPDRRRSRSRSQSPRSRRDRDNRSPRRSSRWRSPRRKGSVRDRSRSRSHSHRRRRSSSLSRRVRPRSRSDSIGRRSSRHDRVKSDADKPSDSRHEVVKMPAQPNSPKKAKRGPSTKAGSDHDDKDREEEKKAGLFTADEFEKQRKLAAKRKDMLRGVDSSDMGANAETVYRDKRGRKLDMLNEMVRQQEVLEGKRKREAREEYEWGTGAVQKRERKSQLELMDQMKDAPFARHEDDEELERMRRERVRAFDPIHSKVFQEDPLADEGKSKKKKSKKDKKEKKESVKTKPKYAGPPAPPNRFGIQPGYRWDGVVRGTNWEEKIMMKQNASTAISEEAYKYAVADM